MRRLLPFLLCLTLSPLLAEPAKPAPSTQVAQEFTTTLADGKKASMSYWLYLPANAAAKDVKLPFVLFLHGSGERGTDLAQVKKHGPPSLVGTGKNKDMEGCIIVSPQCPDKQWWDAKLLKLLCDDIVKTQPVDPNRLYVTGLSMGGFGTWSLLAENPDFFAAGVPICGGGKPETAEKFKHVPVWAFHGAKDSAVPVKGSEEMIAALEKAGGKPKLTIYPDEDHASWVPAYNDPALWTWLVAQKKPAAKP